MDESAKTRRFTSPSSDQIEEALQTREGLGKWWPVPAAIFIAAALIFGVIESRQPGSEAVTEEPNAVTPAEEETTAATDTIPDDQEGTTAAAAQGGDEAAEEVAEEEVAEEEVAEEEVAEEEVAEATAEEEPAEAIEEPEPEPPALATIRVATLPTTATLTMDGARVANPYSAEVEQTDARRRFEASADGYQSASITVALSADQSEVLRLEPTPPPRPAASEPPPRAQPAMRRRSRARARPTPRPRMRRASMARQGTGFVSDNPY